MRDRSGTVLGSSVLEEGTITDQIGDEVTCTLTFTVPDLPDTDFYNIEVSDRGTLGYTKVELENANWSIHLEL